MRNCGAMRRRCQGSNEASSKLLNPVGRSGQLGKPCLLYTSDAADDLGLAEGVDAAILDLAQSGRLQWASLLVNVPSATAAVEAWRDLADPPPLSLHVCLTEGQGLPNSPDLPTGFGRLLLASVLP